jgi:hypothetical protein
MVETDVIDNFFELKENKSKKGKLVGRSNRPITEVYFPLKNDIGILRSHRISCGLCSIVASEGIGFPKCGRGLKA